jgi:CubicO group peptidase (beta-lactamase class C family)
MTIFKHILAFVVAIVLWTAVVLIGAAYGWWMNPIAPTGDTRAFMDAATRIIEEENQGNVALVLLESGDVFDSYYSTLKEPVNGDMLFPTASMSKWIAACGVMKMVEDGKINLDDPIAPLLTRWQLPPSEFDDSEVTVRRLLSHTSGLTDDLGFADYGPDEVLPTLEESLSRPKASSGKAAEIKVGLEPGTEWRYSGGGYLVLQLLVEEVTGKTFPDFMKESFFEPLDMSRSTYEYLGPLENTSRSYDAAGEPATMYQYAAASATGFSTSANDLTRFVQAQVPQSTSSGILADESVVAMRQPHGSKSGIDIWGLGTMLYAPASSGDYVFGHDGGNEPAINSAARINPDTGDAIIVLVTGHKNLASTLGFHWVLWQTGTPDFLSVGLAVLDAIPILLFGYAVIAILGVVYARRQKSKAKNEPALPDNSAQDEQ